MKPLWDKGQEVDATMHRLTVGDDPIYDQVLLYWDCIGSAAHTKVLEKAGILSVEEKKQLLKALHELSKQAKAGLITISPELEDAHTTIESMLVSFVGDTGKKVHTGRSRNDQVITAVRLYLRDTVRSQLTKLLDVVTFFEGRFAELENEPLPGYTHLQPAMPATMGMWLHAFIEGGLELVRDGVALLDGLNINPLGAAAGFGSSLLIDREYSAKLLGFKRAQRNFIDIQNSRGRYEERYLFWVTQTAALFEKFAWDVELFCTKEFGFFSLPDRLTTGSSIMPQKKNPDIVELLRARCGKVRGYLSEIQWITGKLPSHYHRDLQLSKEPFIKGVQECWNILDSVALIVHGFAINKDNIKRAMTGELFATYEAYRQVKQGTPFRDAYKITADLVKAGSVQSSGYDAELKVIADEVKKYFVESSKETKELKEKLGGLNQQLSKVESEIFL